MTVDAEKRLTRPDDQALDPVTTLISEVRVPAASIATFVLGEPAGIDMHGPPYAFIVLDGSCWFKGQQTEWLELGQGDALLALRGDHARLSTRRDDAGIQDIDELWRHSGAPPTSFQGYRRPLFVAWGEGPPMCRMIGMALTLSPATKASTLVSRTPPVIALPAEHAQVADWSKALAAMLAREIAEPAEGYIALCAATAQLFVTQMLRAHLKGGGGLADAWATNPAGSGIARLVRDLHLYPAAPWSIADMAQRTGMSRTSFVERFATLTGTSPFRYLATCRMDHAAQALARGDRPVSEIAGMSGYQSERAFRAAFIRAHGVAPLAYRKRALRDDLRSN
jgi:AraC-like DNA-binding protein